MTFLTNLSLLFVFPAGSDDRIQPWRYIFWYKRKYQVCFCIERWYGRVRVRVRVRVCASACACTCTCACAYVYVYASRAYHLLLSPPIYALALE